MPGVREVREAPFPPVGAGGGIRLLIWTLRARGRFRGFDGVVYLGRSPMVRRWLRFLTGSPMRSGGDFPLGGWETTIPQKDGELVSAAFAGIAGVSPPSLRPVFPVSKEEMRQAAGRLEDGSWLAVAPGGGDNPRDSVPQKRWPPRRFAEVCRAVMERGLGVVLLGGPSDLEAAALVEAEAPGVLNLAGATGWGETAALLSRAGLFLGADSGPAHLATATGARAVVLFGPTSPECLYGPGLITAVASTAECSPCYSNMPFPGCRKSPGCMESITVPMVMDALEPLLKGRWGQ
jgi:ADP-heptose:LPS heptosyltransferase